MKDYSERISKLLEGVKDVQQRQKLTDDFKAFVKEVVPPDSPEEQLGRTLHVLYGYEANVLKLIKDYKEEIKFVNSVQEDIRREKVQFFTNVLGEVAKTLKESKIDDEVNKKWLMDFVESMNRSLDLSGDIAKSYTIDLLNTINENLTNQVNKAKKGLTNEEPKKD